MDKGSIRQRLLDQRKQLTGSVCQCYSLQIQQRLLATDCFSSCKTLALYNPINNEVQTDRLLAVAREFGKRICFPRVCNSRMQFVASQSEADFVVGKFGIAEPETGEVVPVDEIDLVVVPGVAFDCQGFRLGYGKGFYDRELSRPRAATLTVGLCYDFQLCKSLPVEAHDQQLDYIATQTQLIPCRKDVAGLP